MVVLLDTNIIIDFLQKREPFFESASKIMDLCGNKTLIGYIATHSIPNIWYILRSVPIEIRRNWLYNVCTVIRVIGFTQSDVLKALADKEFVDFED